MCWTHWNNTQNNKTHMVKNKKADTISAFFYSYYRFPKYINRTKNTPPINAMNTPACTIMGANKVRPNVSAHMVMIPPNIILTIPSSVPLYPIKFLVRNVATNPINPIAPANAITGAMASTDNNNNTAKVDFTLIPKNDACFAPRLSGFISLEYPMNILKHAINHNNKNKEFFIDK